MMEDIRPLGSHRHVPLAEPTPDNRPMAGEQERDDMLLTMAGLVDSDGSVNIDAMSEEEGADHTVITGGELGLVDAQDPYVAAASGIASDEVMSLQQKYDALKDLDLERQDGERPESKARATLAAIEEESSPSKIDEDRNRVVNDQIAHFQSMQQIISDTKRETVDEYFEKGAYLERTTEFVASEILPTGWVKSGHWDPAKFAQTLVPELELGASDFAVFGDKLDEVRDIWQNLPPNVQVERANAAKAYIISRQGTFGTDNKWEAERLNTVFAGIIGNVKQYDAAKQMTFFEPIMNMGTLGIGGAIAKGIKGLRKGVPAPAPLKIMAETAPASSKQTVQAAVDDISGGTAKAMGTRRAEVIEDYGLHNAKDDPILRGPELSAPDETTQEISDEIIRLRSQHNLASAEEIEVATDKLLNKAVDSDHVQISKSAVYRDNDQSLKAQYFIKPDESAEFSTIRETQEFIANKVEPFQLDDVRVLKLDPKTLSYKPITGEEGIDDVGGYAIQADYRQTLNNIAIKEEGLFKGSGNTWLETNLDTTVNFDKRVADAITGVELTGGQVESIMTRVIAPYRKAPRNSQLRANEILKEGNEARKTFNDAELRAKLGDDEAAIGAYKAVRQVYDINHNMRNVQLRDHLQSAGFRQISYGDGMRSYLKRTADEARPSQAWSAKTGRMVEVRDTDEVYDTFTALKYTDEAGDIAAARHVIAEPTELTPLATNVLPKIDGYLGSHLNARWIIKETKIGSNGQKVESIKKFGDNATSLDKWMAKYGNGNMSRISTREHETGEFSIQGEAELMADLEMLGHTKARSNLNELNDSYKIHLLDPEEAVAKDIVSMTRQAGLQETTKYLVNKWNKTYGHLTVDGQMPWGKFEPIAGLDTADRALAKEAAAFHKRIQIMSGMDDTILAGRFKAQMLHHADAFSTLAIDINAKNPASRVAKVKSQLLSGAANVAEKASDLNVPSFVKNVNHTQFIVFHPARQAVLQSATSTLYVGVKGGTKYALSGNWAKDIAFIAANKMAGDGEAGSKALKTYAKLRGISPAEAKAMFKEFDDSGLLNSISQHQYMEYASRNVTGNKFAGNEVTRGVAQTGRAGTRLAETGFRVGESANLTSAYLVLRNKKVNELGRFTLTPDEARQLAIDAKQLAGNMGTSNKAAFQQGLMGVPFQFMSHNVKMLQLMLPHKSFLKNVSMPILDNTEKAKIGTAYALMWGTGGYAVTDLITEATSEAGISTDDEVQNAIEEGLIGWSIEKGFEALGGDQANIDVSGSFGALAGLASEFKVGDGQSATPIGAVAEFMHSTLMNSTPPLHELLGASGRLLDDPTGSISNAVRLWESPSFSTGEKLHVQMKNLTTFFPAINEYYQARAAAATGQWVNGQGDAIAEASFSEAFAKGILGIEPEAKEAIYNARAKLEGRRSMDKEPEWSKIKQSGKDQANFIAQTLRALNDGQLNHEQFMSHVETAMAVAGETFDERSQFNVFKKGMSDEMKRIRTAEGTTLEKALIDKLLKDKWKQGETSYEIMFSRLKSLPPSEHRDWALEVLPHVFGNGDNDVGNLKFESE